MPNWTQDRADAERLADELNWRIGQANDGTKLLYRPGLATPIQCKTWLAMATYLYDYLQRRRGQDAPPTPATGPRPPIQPVQPTTLAQQPRARVTKLAPSMRPATPADAALPVAKVVD